MHSFKTLEEFIINDDHDKLRSFLESRSCNVNDFNDTRETALMIASGLGKLDVVQLLLTHKANVALSNVDGLTALHSASKNGHAEVCAELLEAGANIEAVDSGGWTPFIWYEVITYFENQIVVSKFSFFRACYKGQVETVSVLVEGGADINAREFYSLTGLTLAAGRGHVDVIEALLKNHKIKVDAGDKYGTTSLIWAARAGHVEICDLLLKGGANVDAVGMYSWTPLLEATRKNHADIVDLLIQYNPNINIVDKDGMTALAIACKEGFTEIALILINAGSYSNLQDRSGDTHLIHAAKGGHKTIVEALLKKYADVNIRGKEGKTCLHWAIDKNHTNIVKILIASKFLL